MTTCLPSLLYAECEIAKRYPSPQVLRRAKLTETAMWLAVLGLTADAERFTLVAS